MKLRKILISLLTICTTATFAQTIPNGNFESWTNRFPAYPNLYPDEPAQGWSCIGGVNQDSIFVSKVSDGKGGSAMRLRNVKGNTGEINPATAIIYFPSKNVPAKLSGRIKYRFGADEAGMIGFGVSRNKEVNFIGIKTIRGNQSDYVSFEVNALSITEMLFNNVTSYDSVFLMITTKKISFSDFSAPIESHESSFVEVDDLAFSGTLACCKFPVGQGNLLNPNFESFEKLETSFVPSGWYLSNYFESGDLGWFEKSADAQSGVSSLKIKTGREANSFFMFSFFQKTAGQNFINLYTKYNLLETDTLFFQVLKYSKQTGFGEYKDSLLLSNASQTNFAPISLSLKDFAANDTISVGVFYQNALKPNFRTENTSGGFWLDNATVSSQPLGINNEAVSSAKLYGSISPNPTLSEAMFEYHVSEAGLARLEMYDAIGNLVHTVFDKTILAGVGVVKINLQDQPAGLYTLKFSINGSLISNKIIKN